MAASRRARFAGRRWGARARRSRLVQRKRRNRNGRTSWFRSQRLGRCRSGRPSGRSSHGGWEDGGRRHFRLPDHQLEPASHEDERASDDPIAATPQSQRVGRLHLLRNREMRWAVVSATGASLAVRAATAMALSVGALQGSSFALEMSTEHGGVLGTATVSSIPIASPSASLSSPALWKRRSGSRSAARCQKASRAVGQLGIGVTDPGNRCLEYQDHEAAERVVGERQAAGETLKAEDAERPQIRTPVRGFSERLLGAHVARRAHDRAGFRGVVARRIGIVMRDPEVQDLHDRLARPPVRGRCSRASDRGARCRARGLARVRAPPGQ